MMLQFESSQKSEKRGFITIFSNSFIRANKLAYKHYKENNIHGKPQLYIY